ncbi:hypothetical protein, partial [Mycolicibacterium goodii]|uniref:hypothetical protein n=1 Tax=Mycolicibacterium goodii TaxID=134601 RepID=UPI001A7E0E12
YEMSASLVGSSVVVGVSSVVSEGVELGLLLGTGMVLSAELEGMEGSCFSEGIVDSFRPFIAAKG